MIEIPTDRFQHIHIDLVGPLNQSNGYSYLLTIIDRFSRWPDAIPLRNINTDTIVNAIIYHWISKFGVPCEVTTDQGTQFESLLFRALTQIMGSHKIRTTAYHPQSNGVVERFHRHLKSSIRAVCTDKNWYRQLPWILLGIRTSLKEDIGCSSAHILYGQGLRVPGEFVVSSKPSEITPELANQIRDDISKISPFTSKIRKVNNIFVPQNFQSCTHVLLREETKKSSLDRPYSGPHKIISKNEKFFTIEIGDKHKNISIDRLKPAILMAEGSDRDLRPSKKVTFNA